MEWLCGILALLAGAAIALQPVMNAAASSHLGHPIWGALASAAVTFLLLAMAPIALRLPIPKAFVGFPPWLYGGGVIGAFMLLAALLAVSKLGATTTAALIITGQLVAALIIDHAGWLGVPVQLINLPKIIGALLLLGGMFLIHAA